MFMLTISDRVKSWIREHPTYATLLAEGVINSSALARKIRPEIEAHIGEPVSQEAITLALNRQAKQLSATSIDFDQYIGEVSVQSGLSIMTIPQVGLDHEFFTKAIAILHRSQEYTLYSRGVWHTSLIGKQSVIEELQRHFNSTIIAHDLVAVTVKLKPGHLPVPGVCAHILQKIAFRGINLQEVTSSHDEMTLLIHRKDTNKALDCLV